MMTRYDQEVILYGIGIAVDETWSDDEVRETYERAKKLRETDPQFKYITQDFKWE
jgi:hypothetical protein